MCVARWYPVNAITTIIVIVTATSRAPSATCLSLRYPVMETVSVQMVYVGRREDYTREGLEGEGRGV